MTRIVSMAVRIECQPDDKDCGIRRIAGRESVERRHGMDTVMPRVVDADSRQRWKMASDRDVKTAAIRSTLAAAGIIALSDG